MTNQTSRVLTLVFTDLADSTALKREFGDQAVGDIIARHREYVTRIAEESLGRVIDWAGDGCFLTFDTSSAGVMFALRLQQAHAEDENMPGVRVGLHMGEVTEKEGPQGPGGPPRIEGLAVDLAARIQGLAKPGQVLMSSAVYQSARQRLGVDVFGAPILWQAHGDYSIKGFDDALNICEAGLEGLSPLAAPEASEKAQPLVPLVAGSPVVGAIPSKAPTRLGRYAVIGAFFVAVIAVTLGTDYFAKFLSGRSAGQDGDFGPITSLAVLPLDNFSGDSEQEYFSDGMTEAITAELAKIKALKVISRTSAMQYKGTTKTMPQIARELGVDALIEGSVMREGDNVRISLQLVDGRADTHIWAESYTDTLTSVLKLQSDVALEIAQRIRVDLSSDERSEIAAAEVANAEAYEAYLRGNYFYYQYTKESLEKSAQAYARAIELDPKFAVAHARLAMSLWVKGWWYEKTEEDGARKRRAIADALALDPSNDDAHVMAAWTALVDEWNWEKAEHEIRIALELNPNNPDAHNMLCWYYSSLARFDDAVAAIERSIELDPMSFAWNTFLADHLYMADRFQECLETVESVLELDPGYFQAVAIKARVLHRLGRTEEAWTYVQTGLERTNRHPNVLEILAEIATADGQVDQVREIARELHVDFDRGSATPMHLAQVYAALGEWDQAFEWVERAVDAHDNAIISPHYPTFRRLWGHPRFNALLDRMNYPGPYPQADVTMRPADDAPIEKLAVLPFDNMSSDPEQEYFVDGMTEALIAELAKIKSIKVISRTSVMQYKDTDKLIPEIAVELGVDALIEGSVMKAGNDVRITAQLVHGRTDEHLWAETYTNTLENVLKLQAEVALSITDQISAVVTPDERSRITAADTVDPEAYRLYAQGRYYWNLRTPDGFEQATKAFSRAIEIDPDFALAHVGLADVYVLLPDYSIASATQSIPLAIASANRALEIAPNLGEAYATLGYAKAIGNFDWDGAEADFKKSIELSPGYSVGYLWYAHTRQMIGQQDQALALARLAYQLDPLSPAVAAVYGFALVKAGHTEQGLQHFEATAGLHQEAPIFLTYRGLALVQLGEFDSAVRYFDRATAIAGDDFGSGGMSAAARAITGDRTTARQMVDRLMANLSSRSLKTASVAWALAALGDTETAFQWLERSFEDGGGAVAMTYVAGRPFLDSIVGDPRYDAILSRMNLPRPDEPIR